MYQRITPIHAVQFSEKEFLENKLSYPDVWDRAMFNKSWQEKKAIDGRYYLTIQPNTNGETEYISVNDGDYIIREEMGITYTLPKEVFQRHHALLTK